jgi:hypothetical protein
VVSDPVCGPVRNWFSARQSCCRYWETRNRLDGEYEHTRQNMRDEEIPASKLLEVRNLIFSVFVG